MAQAAPSRMTPAAVIQRFDKDGDGKLNEAELTDALAGKAKLETVRKVKEARAKVLENPSPRVLEEFDSDKDGKLSDEEKSKARDAMKARLRQVKPAADTNKDGKLDKGERAAAKQAAGEKIRAVKSRLLERFDEDKDGQLNEAERAKAKAARSQRKATEV